MNSTRSVLLLIVGVLAAFTVTPKVRAKIPDDMIKSAGAIELTTELVDKMDTAAKAVRADDAARAEMAAVKEMDPAKWAAEVDSKCPKTVAHLKETGITADELMKGSLVMLACVFDEKGEFLNSDNETVKANAEFCKENKDRCDKVFGEVMAMSIDPSVTDLDKAKKP